MALRFTDVHGCEGWIDDDLSLSYDGNPTIADSIETRLDEIAADGGATDENFESLVLDLPQDYLVRDAELVDGDS